MIFSGFTVKLIFMYALEIKSENWLYCIIRKVTEKYILISSKPEKNNYRNIFENVTSSNPFNWSCKALPGLIYSTNVSERVNMKKFFFSTLINYFQRLIISFKESLKCKWFSTIHSHIHRSQLHKQLFVRDFSYKIPCQTDFK